jgi:hypothetical protein
LDNQSAKIRCFNGIKGFILNIEDFEIFWAFGQAFRYLPAGRKGIFKLFSFDSAPDDK